MSAEPAISDNDVSILALMSILLGKKYESKKKKNYKKRRNMVNNADNKISNNYQNKANDKKLTKKISESIKYYLARVSANWSLIISIHSATEKENSTNGASLIAFFYERMYILASRLVQICL